MIESENMSDDYPVKTHTQKYFSIESIFQWKPVLQKENLYQYEYEPQKDNVFNFFNFAIRLVKCYRIHEEDLNSAMDIISDLETEALNWSKNKKEDLFCKIKDAFIHLLFASKMFLLGLQKNPQQVAKIMDKITPIDEMDSFNQSAIYAVRSTVLVLCSNEAIEKAITFIDKALHLDPDNAQWISLKALYLRKLRENINPIEPPSMMEKELFESAYKKEPTNVVYKLQVADLYLELSDHILKQPADRYDYVFPSNISLNDHTQFEADSKITKAVEYYENASKKFPENSYVLICCARGFMKLPPPHRDIELARNLLTEGLKKNPKSIKGHLTMALLLEEYDNNVKKAKWHLEICQKLKSFEADLVMVRIMHNTAEDPVTYGFKALQGLVEKYDEKLQLAALYSQMVSFYLFIKYDLIKACHYTEKFYQLNSASTCMKIHRSLFIDYPTPFSLINVVMDEIKYKKRTPRSPDSIRQICEDFEIFMCYQNVRIASGFPQNLRWKILQKKPIDNVQPQNDRFSDRNTRPVTRNEPRRFESNGDLSNNNRYNASQLRRSESMNEFPRRYDNNTNYSQNGNSRYPPYQDRKINNNTENYRNNERPKVPSENSTNGLYRNNLPINKNQASPNEPIYLPRTIPSFRDEPLMERERTPSTTVAVKKKSVEKEKSPEPPVVEKRPKESSKKRSDSSSMDSEEEKLVKMVLKSLKKIKSNRNKKSKKSKHRKSSSESDQSESSVEVREKKSRKSKHRKDTSGSESEAHGVKMSKEVVEKRNSRRKEYYSESDSESDDRGKRDYHKEYSRKKYHSHVDSDYSYAEMKKIRGKRRDSPPRSEREKIRGECDSKERKSLKYERSDYSSNDESHSNSRATHRDKDKRSSRY